MIRHRFTQRNAKSSNYYFDIETPIVIFQPLNKYGVCLLKSVNLQSNEMNEKDEFNIRHIIGHQQPANCINVAHFLMNNSKEFSQWAFTDPNLARFNSREKKISSENILLKNLLLFREALSIHTACIE